MTKTYNMVSLYNDVIENDKMLSIKLKRDVPSSIIKSSNLFSPAING